MKEVICIIIIMWDTQNSWFPLNGRQIAKEQPNSGGHTDILLLMLCEYCITTHITTNIHMWVILNWYHVKTG